MKSWADHCSSDEESDGERPHKSEPVEDKSERNQVSATEDEAHESKDKDEIPPPLPLEDFPKNHPQLYAAIQDMQVPPFSAHMRNLPFRIQSDEAMARTIEALVDFRYQGQKQVRVASARLGLDRETKKPKGFANMDFETMDEVGFYIWLTLSVCVLYILLIDSSSSFVAHGLVKLK